MSATSIDFRTGALGRRSVLRLALLASVAASAGFPGGAVAADEATSQVERFGASLLRLSQNGAAPFTQRFAQLAPAVDAAFDLQAILRTSVGPDWGTMSPDQQAQLLQVFRQYTVASFVSNFDKPRIGFQITGERDVGAEKIVDGTIGDTKLGFVVRQTASGWRVVDVLADGTISRVATQRSDFRSTLMHGGGQALMAGLQRKVSDLSGGSIA